MLKLFMNKMLQRLGKKSKKTAKIFFWDMVYKKTSRVH